MFMRCVSELVIESREVSDSHLRIQSFNADVAVLDEFLDSAHQ